MYTQNDGAWIKNVAEEARMVDAMRKGADLTVKGTSGRGTQRPTSIRSRAWPRRSTRSSRSAGSVVAMIRVGIGGWVFAPWRGEFYPKGLPQARELEHASRKLTSIEINGTFYRTQKPASFRKWAAETPDDFVFSLKGPHFATNRRVLAEAGSSIERFFASGVLELEAQARADPVADGAHQEIRARGLRGLSRAAAAAARRPCDPPRRRGPARELRRCRTSSRCCASIRSRAVLVESDKHPLIADVTADFVYARLQRTSEKEKTGYPPARARCLGQARAGLGERRRAGRSLDHRRAHARRKAKRDVFIYMISGAKVRAPAAAMALIERLKRAATP